MTQENIKIIKDIIHNLDAPVTWRAIVDSVEERIGKISRVTLNNCLEIKIAYETRKGEKRSKDVLSKENKKLKAMIIELERVTNIQAQQFQRWSYNAHIEGVSLDRLNAPLSKIKTK